MSDNFRSRIIKLINRNPKHKTTYLSASIALIPKEQGFRSVGFKGLEARPKNPLELLSNLFKIHGLNSKICIGLFTGQSFKQVLYRYHLILYAAVVVYVRRKGKEHNEQKLFH